MFIDLLISENILFHTETRFEWIDRTGAKRQFFLRGAVVRLWKNLKIRGESFKSDRKSQKNRKTVNFSVNSTVKNQKFSIICEESPLPLLAPAL
jgi:hypothetical protein